MKQNNLKIAITGGIGAGKSTVCNIIKNKGFHVYSSDEVYAKLLNDNAFLGCIVQDFGNEILLPDGRLNKKQLSNIVFNNPDALKKLNAITHKKIIEAMFAQAEGDSGINFFEVPLLFEGNFLNLFDDVIVVLRDIDKRIKSVSNRDNLSEEEVKKRIENQYNYKNQSFAQYYVIHNDGNFNELEEIIVKYLSKITQ